MVKPEQLHTMGLYVGGEWFLLTAKPGTYSNDPIGVLDVSVLQEKILGPILGILDQRTDKRIDFVGGIRGLGALEQRVDSGEMAADNASENPGIESILSLSLSEFPEPAPTPT